MSYDQSVGASRHRLASLPVSASLAFLCAMIAFFAYGGTKQAFAQAGTVFVSATNNGPVAAGSDITFTINLTSPIQLNTASLGASAIGTNGANYSCNPLIGPGATDIGSDGNLGVGETWQFTCRIAAPATDVVLTAVGAGVNSGILRQGSVQSLGRVLNPGIDVTKEPQSRLVAIGPTAKANYTITVFNTGQFTLTGVSVADPDCDAGSLSALSATTLASGASATATCSIAVTSTTQLGTIKNRVSAQGTVDAPGFPAVNGQVKTDTFVDDLGVRVVQNGLRIVHSSPIYPVEYGKSTAIIVFVSNEGTLPVTVTSGPSDNLCSLQVTSKADGDNVLQPGEKWEYTCTLNNQLIDTTSVATVSGTDGTNTQSAVDGAFIDVFQRGLSISKKQVAPLGVLTQTTNITFEIYVQNIATTTLGIGQPLTNVVVSDPECGPNPVTTKLDPNGNGMLDLGETWTYTCTVNGKSNDFINSASVTATTLDGTAVTPPPPATAFVDFVNPFIRIIKKSKTGADVVKKGDSIAFVLDVINTGQITFTTVTPADQLCTSTGGTIVQTNFGDGTDGLSPGETWKYECSVNTTTLVVGEQTNVATVTGSGSGLSATDSSSFKFKVVNPAMILYKFPQYQAIEDGKTANFTLLLRNSSDIPVSNITLSDPLCSAVPLLPTSGDDGDGILEPNETWRYSCSRANVTADFINVATAKGSYTSGGATINLEDTEAVEVDVYHQDFEVQKTVVSPAPPLAQLKGVSVTFNIRVSNRYTNTSDANAATFTSVKLTDALCPADVITPTSIATASGPGVIPTDFTNGLGISETWNYTCVYTPTTDSDVVNTVSVEATSGYGKVTHDASATVKVRNASIDIDKTPNAPTVISGQLFTFTLRVRNTSPVFQLSNVVVTDPLCTAPIAGNTFSSNNFAGAVGVARGDLNNNALLDPFEVWEYTCAMTITKAFNNIASVTAQPTVGGPAVTDSDFEPVSVVSPGLDLEKSPKEIVLFAGEAAKFTLQVRNTGDQVLSSILITDVWCSGGVGTPPASLAPGAVWTTQCTINNVQANLTNIAEVTAVDAKGNRLRDEESALVRVINNGLNIVKTGPVTATVGTTVTFKITVTNRTSDTNSAPVPLTAVSVSDQQCSLDTTPFKTVDPAQGGAINQDGNLEINEAWVYTCTVAAANVNDDIVNVATVNATTLTGAPVPSRSAQANVNVLTKALNILKWAGPVTPDSLNFDPTIPYVVKKGTDVTFWIRVRNVGETSYTSANVAVTDPQCSGSPLTTFVSSAGAGDTSLDPRDTWTYSCTVAAASADILNTAIVSGTDTLGGQSRDDADFLVKVFDLGIDLEKSPTYQSIRSGENASFKLTVRNTGSTALSSVTIDDKLCAGGSPTKPSSGDTNNDNILQTTEAWVYDCAMNNVTEDTTNSAKVTAVDSNGLSVDSKDDAVVDVVVAGLNVVKALDSSTPVAYAGLPATFRIKVTNVITPGTNSNATALYNVAVTDTLCSASAPLPVKSGNFNIGDTNSNNILDFGAGNIAESWEYTCTVPGASVTANFENVVQASATDAAGRAFPSAQFVLPVKGLTSGIFVDKTPALQHVAPGDFISFTIFVRNTAGITLTPIGASGPVTISTSQPPITPTTGVYNMGIDDALCTAFGTVTGPVQSNPAVNNTLDPNETWTFNCILNPAYGLSNPNFVNTVKVFFRDVNGVPVVSSDQARVVVVNPGLDVTKSAVQSQIFQGDSVTFNFILRNSSLFALKVDPLVDTNCDTPKTPAWTGGDANGNGLLDPTETWTASCVDENVTESYNNAVSASATDPFGAKYADTHEIPVTVVSAGANVVKTADRTIVNKGGTVNFTIKVTNTGTRLIKTVTVEDLNCDGRVVSGPTGDNGDGFLSPTETWSYTCAVSNVPANFVNQANVTIVTTDPFTFTRQSNGVAINVINPGIDVTKQAVVSTIRKGDTAEFLISVKNTGSSDLFVTEFNDPICSSLTVVNKGNGDDTLNAAETWVYSCKVSNAQSKVDNTVSVKARDSFGNEVTDSASASVDVVNPSISITKKPDTQTILKGGTANFTLRAKNRGDVDLFDIKVTDTRCDGGKPTRTDKGNGDDILQPGEDWVYSCKISDVQEDFTNKASVKAVDINGNEVSDTDSADVKVISLGIDLDKKADNTTVLKGANVGFSLIVKNTGSTELTISEISDPLCSNSSSNPQLQAGSDADADGKLDVNETWTYRCTVKNAQADFTNSASVKATDSNGNSVSDEANEKVTVINPTIDIQKDADNDRVVKGATVKFTIKVKGGTGAPFSSVVVNDPLCSASPIALSSGDTNNNKLLDSTETWVYTCSVSNVQNDFTNSAGVTAKDANGNGVADNAEKNVDVVSPTIDIQKSPKDQTVAKGSNVNFTIEVRNFGDVTLANVVVTDDKCVGGPTIARTSGDTNNNSLLESTETWRYVCTVANAQADFINIATVKANDASNAANIVQDSDSVKVRVVGQGKLRVEGQSGTISVVAGGSATLKFFVTNDGDADLTNVTVSSASCSTAPEYVSGDTGNDKVLKPGETWTFQCTVNNVQSNIQAVVSGSGTNDVNQNASDSALIEIKVINNPTAPEIRPMLWLPIGAR